MKPTSIGVCLEVHLTGGEVLRSRPLTGTERDEVLEPLDDGGPLRTGLVFDRPMRVIPQHRIQEIRVEIYEGAAS